jgi:DNA repair ATPase RecN
MGLAASQARLLYLTARQSDLQYMAQIMNNQRISLSNQAIQLTSMQADLQPGEAALEQIQYRLSALNQIDKSLQLQLTRVDNQNDAVGADIQTVKQVITKSIEGFRFGGGG